MLVVNAFSSMIFLERVLLLLLAMEEMQIHQNGAVYNQTAHDRKNQRRRLHLQATCINKGAAYVLFSLPRN